MNEGALMEQVQAMRSQEVMQEFLSCATIFCSPLLQPGWPHTASAGRTVRDHCFKLCVTKPSSSLGSSEQQVRQPLSAKLRASCPRS